MSDQTTQLSDRDMQRDKLKTIYDAEMRVQDLSPLEAVILNSLTVRMFVHEVCKKLLLE